jgi:DNA-binding HxlR family transcriptional regulator
MALSIEKVIHNLHFDRLFLDRIEAEERTSGKKLHTNGIPFHYIAVFKVLLCMREEAMNVENISDNFRKLFGRNINQSSLSRTLNYLNEQLGLVAEKKNPHVDARFSWVKLTNAGKKFQKHLIGSTTVEQPYAPEMRKVINIK